jgi:hypothetical protein
MNLDHMSHAAGICSWRRRYYLRIVIGAVPLSGARVTPQFENSMSGTTGQESTVLYIKIAQWSKDWSGPQTISNDVRRRYQSESEMSSAVGVMPLTASRTLVGLNRIAMSSTRRRALSLYKELHRLGRDYPDPKYPFLFMSCIPIRSSSLHTAMISTPACVDCSRVRPIIFKRACHPELRLCPW